MNDAGTFCILFQVGNERPSKVQNEIYDKIIVTLFRSSLIDQVIGHFRLN